MTKIVTRNETLLSLRHTHFIAHHLNILFLMTIISKGLNIQELIVGHVE